MKKDVEIILKERIKENKKIFSKEELEIINNNFKTIIKIYLLRILDKI